MALALRSPPAAGPVESRVDRIEQWQKAIVDLEREVACDAAAAEILREPLFRNGLLQALDLQRRRRAGRFADPRAALWVLDATALALAMHASYQTQRPEPPGIDDWRRAIEAVDELQSLERRGIVLTQAIAGRLALGILFDWLVSSSLA